MKGFFSQLGFLKDLGRGAQKREQRDLLVWSHAICQALPTWSHHLFVGPLGSTLLPCLLFTSGFNQPEKEIWKNLIATSSHMQVCFLLPLTGSYEFMPEEEEEEGPFPSLHKSMWKWRAWWSFPWPQMHTQPWRSDSDPILILPYPILHFAERFFDRTKGTNFDSWKWFWI